MKRNGKMEKRKYLLLILGVAMFLLWGGKAFSQAGQPFSAGVRVAEDVYVLGDPIKTLIVPKKFPDTKFHLYLHFIDPDGDVVLADDLYGSVTYPEPTKAPTITIRKSDGTLRSVQGDFVTILPGTDNSGGNWKRNFTLKDVTRFYSGLDKPGRYEVWFSVPFRYYRDDRSGFRAAASGQQIA